MATCSWKKYTGPFTPRFDHVLVPVQGNTSILLFGGTENTWAKKNDLWEFNYATKKWENIETQTQPPPVKDHAAEFYNGKMYVFGGLVGNDPTNSLWVFDYKEKKWEEIATDDSFPPPRSGHTLVQHSGKLYVFGGQALNSQYDCLWSFDVEQKKWEKGHHTSHPSARHYHTATVVDGTLIITGGFKNDFPLTEVYSFNFENKSWSRLPDFPFPARSGHAAFTIDGALFVHGGELKSEHGYSTAGDLWKYDLKNNKWTQIHSEDPGPAARLGQRSCAVSHEFFVSGGIQLASDKDWNPLDWYNDIWIGCINQST